MPDSRDIGRCLGWVWLETHLPLEVHELAGKNSSHLYFALASDIKLGEFVTLKTIRVSLCAAFSLLLCACASTPPVALMPNPQLPAEMQTPSGTKPSEVIDTLGLVAYAASMQGKPYVSGGESPVRGFDCSGLVHHVFRQFNFQLPRNSSAMADQLPEIPLSTLRAADLLFFNTQGARYSHVGIYLGDRRFVHAPSPRTGRVIISSIDNAYWNEHLSGARRPEP